MEGTLGILFPSSQAWTYRSLCGLVKVHPSWLALPYHSTHIETEKKEGAGCMTPRIRNVKLWLASRCDGPGLENLECVSGKSWMIDPICCLLRYLKFHRELVATIPFIS